MREEAEDDESIVKYTYLSDIFISPRHAAVPAATRGALLQRLVLHYLCAVAADEFEGGVEVEPPQYERAGRHGHVHRAPPQLRDLREAEAQAASPALSRRSGSDAQAMTPAVRVAPSAWTGQVRGSTDAQVAHYELHLQSVAFLTELVAQYDERATLLARLRTEMDLLIDRVSADHGAARRLLDFAARSRAATSSTPRPAAPGPCRATSTGTQ